MPESIAFGRLTGGRTTKRGDFGSAERDGYPNYPLPHQRGQAGRAQTRQHILATATGKPKLGSVDR